MMNIAVAAVAGLAAIAFFTLLIVYGIVYSIVSSIKMMKKIK